jgi:hypothetical protein
MLRTALIVGVLLSSSLQAFAQNPQTRFWNLTKETVSEFYLAKAGTSQWGNNQCKNDRDGTVSVNERLRLTETPAGQYDAKIVDVKGRICFAKNIAVKEGEIFSLEESDLKDCNK